MTPLRIGYLNQDFFPEVGAGPARVLEMSRHWQSRGAIVTVIAGMPNRRIPGRGEGGIDTHYQGKRFVEEEWQGVRTLRTWVRAGSGRGFRDKIVNMASFMASGFLRASLPRERFDVLIASSPPFPPHISGVALAKMKGIPLVLEIRDLWPDYMVEMGMLTSPRAQRALFGLFAGPHRLGAVGLVRLEELEARPAGRVVVAVHVFPDADEAAVVVREGFALVDHVGLEAAPGSGQADE